MKISKFIITGKLDQQTPNCVIEEIIDFHDELDNDQSFITINDNNKTLSDWSDIASFINRNLEWNMASLVSAWDYLKLFMTDNDPLKYIPQDFIIGLQTPEEPFAINACILYKVCKYHHINLNKATTIEMMANSVRLLFLDLEQLSQMISNGKGHLINLINNIPAPLLNKVEVNHEYLSCAYDKLHNVDVMRAMIEPTTNIGAISLAALIYKVDLSSTISPLTEYNLLKIYGVDNYQPLDKAIRFWYKKDKKLFNLNYTFNPIFEQRYYDNKAMGEILLTHGYSNYEITANNKYELLELVYLSDTFYFGTHPKLIDTRTSILLEEIDEISEHCLLTYGSVASELKAISIEEMILTLKHNKNFSSPFDSYNIISKKAINRLKKYLEGLSNTNAKILLNLINETEHLTALTDENSNRLLAIYKTDSNIVLQILNKLLSIGMQMRGWIDGDYPLREALVATDEYNEMIIRVSESMVSYEQLTNNKIGKFINNLPLVIYKDSEYQKSNNIEKGLTIGDRLRIIKVGDKTNNINSCIRMSSNYICSSAHKYISIIKNSPFDINIMKHIS